MASQVADALGPGSNPGRRSVSRSRVLLRAALGGIGCDSRIPPVLLKGGILEP